MAVSCPKNMIKSIIILWTVLSHGLVYALPSGWQVESGHADFSNPNDTTLEITASDQSIINFDSFNIGSNETVRFIQPNGNSTLLSRVLGNQSSWLNGSLFANGTIFLINPHGIGFGTGSNIQVNNLAASTLGIASKDFLNRNYIFAHKDGAPHSQILNEGNIKANNLALIASSVDNKGMIDASLGSAQLASGNKVTMSFDPNGLIQVEVNEATLQKAIGIDGKEVNSAVTNSGNILAGKVALNAQVASDVFENAIKQTGTIKATQLVEEKGVIKIVSNRSMQISGALDAMENASIEAIEISTPENITVHHDLSIKGNSNLSAGKDIYVDADVKAESGDLKLLADADLNGQGSFHQKEGTTISTIDSGDVTIQSSGDSTIANVDSSGDLNLKQAGAAARYTQQPESKVTTKNSLHIYLGVILEAIDAQYNVGKDWINEGTFNAGTSSVELTSNQDAKIQGDNTFNNLSVHTPSKNIYFEAGKTQTILGTWAVSGAYGQHVKMLSSDEGNVWKVNPIGPRDLTYAWVKDSYNLSPEKIIMTESTNKGNSFNWDPTGTWTGAVNNLWSVSGNWSGLGGALPGSGDDVVFNSGSINSTIDTAFTITSLTINGYSGTITQNANLSIGGSYAQSSGTFTSDPIKTFSVGGNFSIPTTVGAFSRFTGAGTSGNPYLIYDVYGLQAMIDGLGKAYKLNGNIDATVTSGWNAGAGFSSVGSDINNFTGSLDGNSKTIDHLFINRPSTDYVGLFGFTNGSTIQNLAVTNANITGQAYVGGLAGSNSGSISGSSVGGTITGAGLGIGYYVGGLAGLHVSGTISNSSTSGTISGGDGIGGLVGENDDTIINSFSTANINASGSYAGGLAGLNYFNSVTGSISASYATGNVSGVDYVGGLTGYNQGVISASYSTGDVTASGYYYGGLVGQNDSTVTNSFYNIDTVSVNGIHNPSRYGIYTAQFNDWLPTKTLTLANYYTLSGGYYQIANVTDLKNLLGFSEAGAGTKFKITNSIDLTGNSGFYIPYLNVGEFHGGSDTGKTIANLNLNYASLDYIGLFGTVYSGTVTNVALTNASITGRDIVGALAGFNYGTISNSSATGSVSANSYVGGLVGYNSINSITNSSSSASVNGVSNIGGLIGFNFGAITNSSTTGQVNGVSNVGGLVGYNYGTGAIITNSSAAGNVTGATGVGGLVGYQYTGTISGSSATGSVTGSGNFIGGLAGYSYGTINGNSFATGQVIGIDNVGGLVGSNYGVILNASSSSIVSGRDYIGGLVGLNGNSNSYTITNGVATGTVGGRDYVGGLVGDNQGVITTSHATGNVTATGNYVGGLAGKSKTGRTISSSYAQGIISGVTYVGGLVGYNESTINSSYVDIGSVTGSGNHVGGLVGNNVGRIDLSYATVNVSGNILVGGLTGHSINNISNSYAKGNIIGHDQVGGFTGYNGSTISDSYAEGNVTATGSYVGGFAGYNTNTILNSHAIGDVSGQYNVGGLVGHSWIVTNCYATGDVSGIGAGGLVGYNPGTITSSYATGNVTGSGNYVGGLVAINETTGSIINSHAMTGTISGVDHVGGLVGASAGIVSNSYASGTVIATGSYVGGLVASNSGTINNNSYATGHVTGISAVGGLVGSNSGTISNTHADGDADGDITTGGSIGGLVGEHTGGTITNSIANGYARGYAYVGGLVGYSVGAITGSSAIGVVSGTQLLGGLVGWNNTLGTISASFATGNVTGIGNEVGGLVGRNTSTVTNAHSIGTVTGINYVGGLIGYNNVGASSTANSYATGNVNGVSYVGGLVGVNQTGSNISTSYATGQVSGTTYIGGLVAYNAGGISDSYAQVGTITASSDFAGGLVAYNDFTGTITNSHALGNISGANRVGGLVGENRFTIGSSYASGSVTGSGILVGGLVGLNYTASSTSNSYATGNVSGVSNVGGLVGQNSGTIISSHAMGNVTGTGGAIGGLVGDAYGAISDSYATGIVMGGASFQFVGGLIGYLSSGVTVNHSYATGAVSGYSSVGGLVGYNTGGLVTNSYAMGNITGTESIGGLVGINRFGGSVSNSYSTGNVSGVDAVGGLVGQNYTSDTSVSNSYATGNVVGTNSAVGGLMGINYGTITNAYATGTVNGHHYVGGLSGFNIGAIINSYATGIVTILAGGYSYGGLVGHEVFGTITNCAWWTGQTTNAVGGYNPIFSQPVQFLASQGWGTDVASISDFYSSAHAVYTGASSWNFTSPWFIESMAFGLPILRIQIANLAVTGAASVTAGVATELAVRAYDYWGNLSTGFVGNHRLTFSGLNIASDGVSTPQVEGVNVGTAQTVNFVAGDSVAGTTTLVAYKAENALVGVSDQDVNATGYELSLTVNPAAAASLRFSVGSATVTAGNPYELIIKAYDLYGNLDINYFGAKTLTFSGLSNSPDGNVPTVEGTNFGSGTGVTFTSGVSNVNTSTLAAYKVETASIDVSDGSINSTGNAGYDLDLTVTPATAASLRFSVGSATVSAGTPYELLLRAFDAYGNLDINYSGAKSLTFLGLSNSLDGFVPSIEGVNLGSGTSVIFASGESNVNAASLSAYKAETASLDVSDGTINSTSAATFDLDLTVDPVTAASLRITGASPNATAGTPYELTIKAHDMYGNVATSYTGNHLLTFSGLSNALTGEVPSVEGVNQGSATTVNFTTGVSDSNTASLTAYKTESVTVNVTDGLINSVGYGLGLTVGAGAANNLLFLSQPTNTNHGISQNPAVTVQVRDAYNNVRVQDNSTNVNLTLGPNPYSATLSGTLTRTSVGGIASFNDISINKVGNHYTLLANSAGLTGDTSSQFNIENFGIITWVGDVSTNWDDPENWVGGVPTISSIVTIQSTLNQPIFNTHTRLEALTLELGSHLTTLGYDLSLSQNLTLQGTLIVSNSTITAKLVQGSSTGLISGSTPTISSTEVIGLLDAPINFNTTGPATLYAGSMKDLTSISVAGTGSYRMAGSISGFAFINGRLQPYIGQESFRNLLNQASLSQIRLGGFTSMFKLFSPLKNKSFKINPVNISFKTPVEQTKEWKTTKVVDQTKKQESFKVEPNGNIGSSENSRLLSKPQMLNPLPMVNQK